MIIRVHNLGPHLSQVVVCVSQLHYEDLEEETLFDI